MTDTQTMSTFSCVIKRFNVVSAKNTFAYGQVQIRFWKIASFSLARHMFQSGAYESYCVKENHRAHNYGFLFSKTRKIAQQQSRHASF